MKHLILSTVCMLFCATGLWAQTLLVDGIYYDLSPSAKTASVISGGGSNYSGDIVIPPTVIYNETAYSVTSIGERAFDNCTGLTSITIPSRVTSIGYSAFFGCTGLTNITLPNSVTRIGNSAFSGCTGLTNITLPNSVTIIGDQAFYNCTGLTSITIPNGVTIIGDQAFYNCTGLTSITIPSSVTSIGISTFGGYNNNIETADINSQAALDAINFTSKLINIKLGDKITSIGEYAFRNCNKLTSITIPNSVTSIGNYAFEYCTGLTNVTIPNGVTSIGEYAFSGCSRLTNVTIPNGVTSIGESAFYHCTGLTSVTIPNSVTSIGNLAFSKVKHVIYTGSATGSPWGAIAVNGFVDGDFVFSDDTKTRLEAYIGKGGDVTIPNGVTIIGDQAFYNCTGLTSITIPNSVTSIGNYAFEYCTGLTSVTIPNSVTSIGNIAFSGCSRLTSVTIPNSVTSIGDHAFNSCKGLTSIEIPNSVTSIGYYAFECCYGLTSIIVPCGKRDYFIEAIPRYAAIIISGDCIFEVATKANNEDYGTVTGEGVYEYGTSITLTATPNDHYHFVKWNDNNTQNPRTVQVTQDSTFTAIFAIDNVTLSKNISAAGTVTGGGVYEYNTTVQLTATANEGYRFKGWSDGVTDASREIIVTKDTSITANFVALYTIKALASASQGTVSGGGIYEDGEIVTLVANAKPGYVFAQWADGSGDNPRNVVVNRNKTYTAIFMSEITAVSETEEHIVETARYDINGRPLTAPTKGVNIVKYSDGSFKKEFVR